MYQLTLPPIKTYKAPMLPTHQLTLPPIKTCEPQILPTYQLTLPSKSLTKHPKPPPPPPQDLNSDQPKYQPYSSNAGFGRQCVPPIYLRNILPGNLENRLTIGFLTKKR